MVKCCNCGLLYVNPRPDDVEIDDATKTGHHKGKKIVNATGRFKKSKIKAYLNVLSDFYEKDSYAFSKNKWIDIGAGHGEFLKALEIFFGQIFAEIYLLPNKHKIFFII